ncbi:MAG: ATP-binding cassette domain-containing protein [Gammaproteobacteria bacterium]|nr:ATP-binding cassette domain-containing protein [Gammaproteobacteria bacterium]
MSIVSVDTIELPSIILDNVFLTLQNRIIFNDLSITFKSHGISFIMGDNGAGKTQLLRTIHGLVKPNQGQVDVPFSNTQAFLYQSPILLSKSVEGNLRFVRGTRVCSEERFDKYYQSVVSFFLLADILRQPVSSLSGGQKKRVALARLFLQSADYYLLDEPSANIDRTNNLLIDKFVNQMVDEGKKVLMTTHDYPQLARLFVEGRDEIVCLKDGTCADILTALEMDRLHLHL